MNSTGAGRAASPTRKTYWRDVSVPDDFSGCSGGSTQGMKARPPKNQLLELPLQTSPGPMPLIELTPILLCWYSIEPV